VVTGKLHLNTPCVRIRILIFPPDRRSDDFRGKERTVKRIDYGEISGIREDKGVDGE